MHVRIITLSFICSYIFGTTIFAQPADALKADIYSKINDRRCSGMTLDKCNCPEARAMKAYVDAFLEMKVPEGDIFYRVAKKYSLRVIADESTRAKVEKRLIDESGGKNSRGEFEPVALDFGSVSKKQGKVSMVAKLYNKGNSDLIITNIRVSCGCVTAALKTGKEKSPYFGVSGAGSGWQTNIAPGKYGELEVVLDLNHSSMGIGKQVREVFVAGNNPLEPESILKAVIEVKE